LGIVGYRIYGYRKGASSTSYLGAQRAENESEAKSRILKAFPGAKITEMQPIEGQTQEEKEAGKREAIARQTELQDKRYQVRSSSKRARLAEGYRKANG
jgi:hypothetical protein